MAGAIVFDKPAKVDKYGLAGIGEAFGKGFGDEIAQQYQQSQDVSVLQSVLNNPEVKKAIESGDPSQYMGVLARIVADPNMSKEARARALTFLQNAIVLKRKKKEPERSPAPAVSNGPGEQKGADPRSGKVSGGESGKQAPAQMGSQGKTLQRQSQEDPEQTNAGPGAKNNEALQLKANEASPGSTGAQNDPQVEKGKQGAGITEGQLYGIVSQAGSSSKALAALMNMGKSEAESIDIIRKVLAGGYIA